LHSKWATSPANSLLSISNCLTSPANISTSIFNDFTTCSQHNNPDLHQYRCQMLCWSSKYTNRKCLHNKVHRVSGLPFNIPTWCCCFSILPLFHQTHCSPLSRHHT
jgi:hypothetical protein